jgi:hypothetical protein
LEEEDTMKKFGYIIAALATIAIAAPTMASAEKIVIKSGHHDRDGYRGHRADKIVIRGRHEGARAEFREHGDRGWHRGWRHGHGDRVVVIKRGHHHDRD